VRVAVQVTVPLLSADQLVDSAIDLLARLPRASASVHDALYQLWQREGHTHHEAVTAAYTLAAGLQRHAQRHPLLQLVHQALRGEASGASVLRITRLLQEAQRVLQHAGALHLPGAAAAGAMQLDDAMQLLQQMFPAKSDEELGAIHACLAAGASSGPATGSDVADISALRSTPQSHLLMPSTSGPTELEASGDGVLDAAATAASAGYEPEQLDSGEPEVRRDRAQLLEVLAKQHASAVLAAHVDLRRAMAAVPADLPDDCVSPAALRRGLLDTSGIDVCDASTVLSMLVRAASGSPEQGFRAQDLAAKVAQVVPMRLKCECDAGAALQWLQGLSAEAQGHGSTAELPDVA
jgi:hypothetical protein